MPLNLIFTQPGTFTVDDNGIPGDNISVIRDSNGVVIFTFLHPADALGFTVSTPGVNLIINFTDSLGGADFSIGDLTNSAITPDSVVMKNIRTTGNVTLVSNGSITEGGADAAADIVAGSLVMSAVAGVGTGGNAIETQTGLMEVETVTGGINIRNTGSVQIGGLTDQVNGLDVLTSGNLTFTAIGSIFLSDIDLDAGTNPPNPPPQSVHGGDTSGNVSLTASGFLADIITNTDTDAITAPRGNITLTAGRDIAFGTIGVDFDNDVRANGSITINAGRDFLIDGFSDLSSDDFFNNTGGDVIINTGRNIQVRNIAGSDATITASGSAGADVLFTTGFGGAVILDAPSTAVGSSSGDVIISADRMLINAASGITASAGQVTLRPATAGRGMILGSASDAALAVELADSELDRVFTNQLTLGGDETGLVRIIAPFSPANTPDLTIRSGTDISIESSFSAIDAITLRAADNISQLGATLVTAGGIFSAFVDDAQDDGSAGGTGILRGAVTATSVTINGNLDADTLEGTDGDDVLKGNGGNDTLRGRGGSDVLDGGTGADQMTGGLGDDEFIVDIAGDVVIEGVGEGIDTVKTGISLTLAANVENLTLTGGAVINGTGNTLANTLLGNTANNILDGKADADTMKGGTGNDTYVVDNVGDVVTEFAGQGTDIVQAGVTYTIANNIENLTLTGGAAINGTGNGLVNILTGNGANNTLDGKAGADTMIGGLGGDTYVVDNAGDVVTETGAGTDTVQSTITFTLGTNFENLTLTGAAAINGTGNTVANILTGNGAANTLSGLGGNDTLNGGGGADTMSGGLGNDTYVVDNAGDIVTEGAGEGTDIVQAGVAYTIANNIENLTLTGAGNINGTGNGLANTLLGNTGNNTLDGKAGADTMKGGTGNDTYVVDNAGDIVTEFVGQGTDIVQAGVTYTIANNIENVTLTGAGNIDGTGNGLANTLLGNTGNNTLDGKVGADTMKGGTGDDTYVVDNVGDVVTEFAGQGTDIVQAGVTYTIANNIENLTLTGAGNINGTGNGLVNILTGNGANNILSGLGGNDQILAGSGNDDIFGGAGNDDLTGGAGMDKFRFDAALNAATNVDDILDFSVADDSIFLDRDIFAGIAANGALVASAFVNGTVAGDANDRIIYNSATGSIFYDADGNAAGAQTLFATVTAGTALTSADFIAYI